MKKYKENKYFDFLVTSKTEKKTILINCEHRLQKFLVAIKKTRNDPKKQVRLTKT